MKKIVAFILINILFLIISGCEKSEITQPLTEAYIPPPTDIYITDITTDSVMVSWNKPDYPVEKFEVYANLVDEVTKNLIGSVSSEKTEFSFSVKDINLDFLAVHVRSYANHQFSEYASGLRLKEYGNVTFDEQKIKNAASPKLFWSYDKLNLGFNLYKSENGAELTLIETLGIGVREYEIPAPKILHEYKYAVTPVDLYGSGEIKSNVLFNYELSDIEFLFEEEVTAANKVIDASFLTDNTCLIIGDEDFYSLDIDTRAKFSYSIAGTDITEIRLSAVQKNVSTFAISGGPANIIYVYNSGQAEPLFELKGHLYPILSMVLNNTGTRLYSVDNNGVFICWDLTTRAKRYSKTIDDKIIKMVISPGQDEILACTIYSYVYKIDLADGSVINTFRNTIPNSIDIVIEPNRNYFALRNESLIAFYSFGTGERISYFNLPGLPNAMDFTADGFLLANYSDENAVVLNPVNGKKYEHSSTYYGIRSFRINHDTNVLLASDDTGYIAAYVPQFAWKAEVFNF